MQTKSKGLTARDYRNALLAQSACNFGALVNALKDVLEKIQDEALFGSAAQAEHPIVRLYLEQLMHLGCKTRYFKAHAICIKNSGMPEEGDK